jgi:ribonuclease P protein component
VGRKIGGAVTRNRLKRRLRSIARAHWAALPEADIAVLARPAAAALDYAGLEAAFRDLAARAVRRISASPAPSAPEPPR